MARRDKQKRHQAIAELAANTKVDLEPIECSDELDQVGVFYDDNRLIVRIRSSATERRSIEINLSKLLNRKELALALARVIEKWGINKRPDTIKAFWNNIWVFWTYLNFYEENNCDSKITTPSLITQEVCDEYILWLDTHVTANKDPRKERTKAQIYADFRSFITQGRPLCAMKRCHGSSRLPVDQGAQIFDAPSCGPRAKLSGVAAAIARSACECSLRAFFQQEWW